MAALPQYICHICKSQFKREDYLQRHRLSHGNAEFQCDHPGCGLAFHRKDVLKRHRTVHVPDPNVKRRRPRRGINPHPFIQPALDISSPEKSVGAETGAYLRHDSAQQLEDGGSKFASPALDGLSLPDLDFCSLHFQFSCQSRNPFMHHTSLARHNMHPSKRLAMAVIGANAIPRFQNVKRDFFEKAKAALVAAHKYELWTRASATPSDESLEALNQDLELVQATVLLLEYAFWSNCHEDKVWAREQASQLVITVVPDMVRYIQTLGESSYRWAVWVHREQCIRLIWSLCNVLTKIKNFRNIPTSSPSFKGLLPLPSCDAAFAARDEVTWLKELEASDEITDFSKATYLLSSAKAEDKLLPYQISCIGRHILLVCLLDWFQEARISPFNFNSLETYRKQDLSGFERREAFQRAIKKWKRLWWGDPAELFYTEPQKLADFQNAFFVNYLEILILVSPGNGVVTKSEFLSAMDIVCTIFYTVSRDGLFEVSKIVSFLIDNETRFYVTTFARLMISWTNTVIHHELSGNLEEDDFAIFTQCYASLKSLSSHLHQPILNSDLTDLNNLKAAIFEIWSTVLDRRNWADDIWGSGTSPFRLDIETT